jgi:hypothetical protein
VEERVAAVMGIGWLVPADACGFVFCGILIAWSNHFIFGLLRDADADAL